MATVKRAERFPQYAFLAINISLEIEIFFLVHILRWLCDFGGENVHMNIGFSRLVHIDMWQWTLCMQPVNAMVWKGFFALVEIYPCEMAPIWHIGIYLKSKIVISKAINWIMIWHLWNQNCIVYYVQINLQMS